VEGNDGGRFTHALIKAACSLPLHKTSYVDLMNYVVSSDSFDKNRDQKPRTLGLHKSRIVFHALPFIADERYIPLDVHPSPDHVKIKMGSQDGIRLGTQLSMHSHNRRASLNPTLDNLKVLEVHNTWCLARRQSRDGTYGEWAQITQKLPSKSKYLFRRSFTLW